MGLLIRTLWVWLLVLAVPAQGAAAVTMTFCGPNHQGGAAATSAVQAASAGYANLHSAEQSVPGHHDTAAQADEDDSTSTSPAASSQSSQAVKHKCSACASCCSMGALLSPVLAVPAPAVTTTVFCTVVPTVSAFAADGPDRPPRIVLA